MAPLRIPFIVSSDPGTSQGGWSARVRPRVVVPGSSTGATIRIDRAVCEAISEGAKIIQIAGDEGSGRSTALRYLERELADLLLVFMDAPCDGRAVDACVSAGRVVVIAPRTELIRADTALLRLAPWGEDELFEWAIGVEQAKRRSVVERGRAVMEQSGTASPEVLDALWSEVEKDDSIENAWDAMASMLRRRHPSPERAIETTGSAAWWGLHGQTLLATEAIVGFAELRRLARHRVVALFAAAEWVARQLAAGSPEPLRQTSLPELVRAVAARVRGNGPALGTVVAALAGCSGQCVDAMGASILNLAGQAWTPEYLPVGLPRNFSGAMLAGARWKGANLRSADLTDADMRGAELSGACMEKAVALRADLSNADLRDAVLDGADLHHAGLSGANLEGASVDRVHFGSARMGGANLGRAMGTRVWFSSTDLRDARLEDADLQRARFLRCECAGVSLRRARFVDAIFTRVDLREAALDDVVLREATLAECVLSQVVATGVDAGDATFRDCDLTGSVLRAARLSGAKFPGCGLAEIWWQGADLRGANFTGSTFHMGSSRSGLVGSVIAGEGSKTGFYTDDYAAQDYKPPEEISKADLRGADLRGAIVEGVDFYLVDLRGAIYEREQAEWFRKCGAILFAQA